MTSYKEKLPEITTFIFDVDGVLTDGNVLMFNNEMIRSFNSMDAYALQYASKMEYNIFIITGGNSFLVKDRLIELGCKEVILSASNKLTTYKELQAKYHFLDEQVLYMGDDIPDYQVLKTVGIATCPQNAAVEIKAICHYQSPKYGGSGCVRDIIEQTLRVQDKWFTEKAFNW